MAIGEKFENGVIFDGTQACHLFQNSCPVFENGVIFDGTQAADYVYGWTKEFENGVIFDGTQAFIALIVYCFGLRMV